MAQQQDHIDNFKDSVVTWSRPRKVLGMYKAGDVEQSVDVMSRTYANMQESYQERFEEQRLSLLAISRERDELARKTREFEAEQKSSANVREHAEILETENIQLRGRNSELEQQQLDSEQLKEQVENLEKQYASAQKELEAKENQYNRDLQTARDDLQAKEHDHARELSLAEEKLLAAKSELQQKDEHISQLQTDLESEAADKGVQIRTRNDQIRLMNQRYQTAMKDHAAALANMAEAYSRHAESIASLDESALERLKE